MVTAEAQFLRIASANCWQIPRVEALATTVVPDAIFGRRRSILQGDIARLWANWFVLGLVDPVRHVDTITPYPHLFKEVLDAVHARFGPTKTYLEKQEIATSAARWLFEELKQLKKKQRRTALTLSDRRNLLDLGGTPPRCTYCGSRFSDVAVELFEYGSNSSLRKSIALPSFVDLLKPSGLSISDSLIEVDHVVPFSEGGEELTLACGWCNRNKSSWSGIYDIAGSCRIAGGNTLGIHSLPQPFWVVRLLGMIKQCEHPGGCTKSTVDSAMRIALRDLSGAPNPSNLIVVCDQHDPLFANRLQPRRFVASLWGRDE